jgi:hypothetical protein
MLAALCCAVAGCDDPHASSTAATASAKANAPTVAMTASAPAPSVLASDAGPQNELAGAWEGTYDAKKSTITLPPKVKDDALGTDDGKAAIGAGKVELTVSASGEVRGKLTGALGAATLTGKVDSGMLRASIRPDDVRATQAMTGILIGMPKGDTIMCDLHVAGPDGGNIRESAVQLKRATTPR